VNSSKALNFNGLEINRAGNNLSADRLPPEKISSSPSICFCGRFRIFSNLGDNGNQTCREGFDLAGPAERVFNPSYGPVGKHLSKNGRKRVTQIEIFTENQHRNFSFSHRKNV